MRVSGFVLSSERSSEGSEEAPRTIEREKNFRFQVSSFEFLKGAVGGSSRFERVELRLGEKD